MPAWALWSAFAGCLTSREAEEAEWFNEVIGAIDVRSLSEEQRRRLPERRPTPAPGFGGEPGAPLKPLR